MGLGLGGGGWKVEGMTLASSNITGLRSIRTLVPDKGGSFIAKNNASPSISKDKSE